MKVALIILVWLAGYLLTLFLWMLICRLNGDDPEDVYELDVEWIPIYMAGLALWPFELFFELLYFWYRALKKWFVLAIEMIIAVKESKEEEREE